MNLFNNNTASNRTYRNIRDADTPMMIGARQLCLDLWEIFEPYADEHFTTEIQSDFNARFWEMDLTCILLELGKEISCPKPGPDIKADGEIWLEAVCPTQGTESNPDRVPDIVTGIALSIDSDPITLRYTSAIEEKYRKYLGYLENGIIKSNEPYIIALNSSRIPNAGLDLPMPRIFSSVLSIGSQYVEFDRKSGDIVGGGFHHKESVTKTNGSAVPIDMFLNPNYSGISAVLYSNSDSCNRPDKNGSGFILVQNPLATNPVPPGWLGVEKEATTSIENETDYSIRWTLYDQI